jgi:hypothetical protein
MKNQKAESGKLKLGGGSASANAGARQRAVATPNRANRRTFVTMKKVSGSLQYGLSPNCPSIARDLEVSVKSVKAQRSH